MTWTLAEFTRDLCAERNWETLVRRGLGRILEASGTPAGALYVHDQRQAEVRMVASHGLPLAAIRRLGRQRVVSDTPGIAAQVVLQRQPVALSDLSSHPWVGSVREELAASGYRSAFAVPLVVENRVVGVVELFSGTPDCLTSEAQSRLYVMCDALSLAISHNQLLTERERRLQIQQTLFDLSQAVVSGLDVGELLPRIVRNAVNLVGGALGCVGLWDEAAGSITVKAAFNCPAQLLDAAPGLGEGLLGQVVAGGQTMLLDELGESPESDTLLSGAGVISAVGVPLRQDRRIAGVLLVATNRPHLHFTWEEAGMLEAFADLAAIAIANASLFRQTRFKADQMAALLKISQRLTESLKLEYVLGAVLKEATCFVRADAGLVHLAGQGGTEFRPVASYGPMEDAVTRLTVPLERVIFEAVTRGEPVRLPGEAALEAEYGGEAGAAILSVPLISGNSRIGALTCIAASGQPFTGDDVTFLATLAGHAAVAIENARLHEETEELSVRDALTGLYNVRRLRSCLADELQRAQRYSRELSFLMIDIDHFKSFNDTYGHQHGDAVLQKVATIVQNSLRSIDQVFRYGGEEICVLLPETPKAHASLVAERIRAAVASYPFQGPGGQPLGRVTVSAGLATYPSDAATQEELVARADQALYRAKSNGRNRVNVWGRPELTVIR